MAQVLITSDDGRVLFDGTINTQHAYDLAELVREEFMAKEWADVPEEELGLETEEAIQQIESPEYEHREVPKGFPVMQHRRLVSAIVRIAKIEEKLEIEIEDWDDGSCAKDEWCKVYPAGDKGK
jgi:hypothetical protein